MRDTTCSGARRGLVRAGGVAALAGVALLGLAALRDGASAEDKKPAAKTDLPSDLAHVPPYALLMASARLGEVWDGEVGKSVRKGLGKDADKVVKEFEGALGLSPGQVERVTLVQDSPASDQLVLVRAAKPYDRKKVLAATAPGAEEQKHNGATIYASETKATYLIDKHSFMTGAVASVKAALEEPEGKGEGLRPALAAAAKKHTAVVGLNPAVVARMVGDEALPAEAEPFKPLLKATSAVLTLDVGATTTADLRVAFPKGEDAKAGGKSLEAAKKLARGGLEAAIKQMAKEKGGAEVVKLLKGFDASLKDATPKAVGSAVVASATMKVEPGEFGVMVVQAVQKVRESAVRIQSANNLKQIALALHNYHDATGRFPAHAVYDKDGKALLSWRVLILPYIEQDALYRKFKLDEPWDSAHNKKLLALMPKVYAAPVEKAPKDATHYQVFYGPGAAFEGKRGGVLTDFTDGTSNTVLLAEAAKAVPWTKPEDLTYDPKKSPPKLGGLFATGFHVGMGDGSVRFIRDKVPAKTLHALITRNGGEVVAAEDF